MNKSAYVIREAREYDQQITPPSLTVHDSIPNDEEISETGLLKQVDDAGYPMVTLTIELPRQHLTESFTINLDDIKTIQPSTLTGLIGSQITFRYTSEVTNAVLDIQVDDTSLLDVDPRIITAKTRQVVGVLGADEITTGDEPGLLLITAADGDVTEFPFYITSELLEVNGTTVTVFYEERTINIIKAITATK
ncbi:hypothetical protein [Fibrella aquatica]|uniref:hypothetical protein n=1 Tax=Fibrella aquatica TaxID=3242487 RepID=UPI00352099C0